MDGGGSEERVPTHPSVSSGQRSSLLPPAPLLKRAAGTGHGFFSPQGGSWDAGAVVGGTKGVYLKTSSGERLIVNRLLGRKGKCQEESAWQP